MSTDLFNTSKHKAGADRTETVDVIPVDNSNRLKEIGPAKKIEVNSDYMIRIQVNLYHRRVGLSLISALEAAK